MTLLAFAFLFGILSVFKDSVSGYEGLNQTECYQNCFACILRRGVSYFDKRFDVQERKKGSHKSYLI